jgi:regulatory protein
MRTEGGGRVTAIRREPGPGPVRFTVFVDGRKAFTLPEEMLERLGLEVGGAMCGSGTPSEADATAASPGRDEDASKARESALRLLAVRARTRRELEGRLGKKGHSAPVVARVLAGLESAGLVDDRAFAALWADERMRLRPVGRRRLAQELRLKGVPPAAASEAVERAFEETSEAAVALRVARAWAGRASPGPRARARLYGLLVRRGFSRSAALEALREVLGERDE